MFSPSYLFIHFIFLFSLAPLGLADRLTSNNDAANNAMNGANDQAQMAAAQRALAAQLEQQAKGQDKICSS